MFTTRPAKMATWKVGSQGGYVLPDPHAIVCVHHPLYTLNSNPNELIRHTRSHGTHAHAQA